jgi:MFS family permease
MNSRTVDINSVAGVTAALLIFTSGAAFFNLQPGTVGALVDELGFSLQQVGNLASTQMIAQVLATFCTAIFLPRCNIRLLARCALLVFIAMELFSSFLVTPSSLGAVRVISGLSGGALLAVGTAVIASMRNPDRAYGIMNLLQWSLTGMALFFLPQLLGLLGIGAIFALLASIAIAALLCTGNLPDRVHAEEDPDPDTTHVHSSERGRSIGLVFASFTFYFLANGMLWGYADRIGNAAGLSANTIANSFGTACLVAILVSLLPPLIADRLGRLKPIYLGFFFMALGAMILAQPLTQFTTQQSYLLGLIFFFISVTAVLPYFLSLLACFDPGGRLGGLAMACVSIAGAVAPALGASLVADADFSTMNYAAVGFTVLAGLVLLPALKTCLAVQHGEALVGN